MYAKLPSVASNAVSDGSLLRVMTMDNLLRRTCAAAGVPYIKMHGLRHTHASHALAAGEPVHAVSQRLGHANVSITLDIYAHTLAGMQEQAAERIAAWLDETG